jgi:hypothetical protein
MVTVREGDKVLTMPAIHAVLRGLVALADKGNGPAQRTLIETVQAIERELAAQMAIKNKLRPTNLKSPTLPRGGLRFSSIELQSRRTGQRRRATRASCGTPRRSPAWSVRYSFQLQKYCGTTVSEATGQEETSSPCSVGVGDRDRRSWTRQLGVLPPAARVAEHV